MNYLCVLISGLLLVGPFASHAATDMTSTLPLMEIPMTVNMNINGQLFEVRLQDNPSAKAFVKGLPLKLEMDELNGNEKFADLPHALPSSPVRPGTLQAGDLMLYGTKTLVLFYASFESSYRYTPVGKVINPQHLSAVVGKKQIQVGFNEH